MADLVVLNNGRAGELVGPTELEPADENESGLFVIHSGADRFAPAITTMGNAKWIAPSR